MGDSPFSSQPRSHSDGIMKPRLGLPGGRQTAGLRFDGGRLISVSQRGTQKLEGSGFELLRFALGHVWQGTKDCNDLGLSS